MKRKIVNDTGIPTYALEKFARCVFPDIQAFFASEEGRREFAEWKAEQEKMRAAENSAALVVIAASSFLSVLWAWIRGVSSTHLQNRFAHIL